jgi:hypothetical protein
MPTHDPHDPIDPHGLPPDSPHYAGADSPGYEVTDVNVNGIVVFLASLFVFVGVFFIFCFGMGKVINTAIIKSDGPSNQWNQIGTQPRGKREDLTSNAVMEQQQLREMVQRFPTPRLQTDDGNLETAELHAREDLLLDNYSWVDRQSGKVRIPIARAMELIAQHGLPVAPEEQTETLMAGDKAPVVSVPLTDGFARTGYEEQYLETLQQERMRGEKPADQAALGGNR